MNTQASEADVPTTRQPVALGRVNVVVALAAALALLAALLGWNRDAMLHIAGGAAALLALSLIYRQHLERQAAQRALHSVEARVGGIVESAMDAIITVDESQRIVLFNAAAEAVFGCSRDAAIGSAVEGFIPERFRSGHAAHMLRFGETGALSRRMGALRIVMGLRRNGEEFPIDASISQTGEAGKRFYTVILRDVTERVRSEEALARSRDEIHSLALAASSAREQEKTRVARELHDELGQSLTALKIDVGWLRENLGDASAPVKTKLGSMQGLLDSTVSATRRIASDLRPLMLDDLGLVAAADWLVQNFTQHTGVPCRLRIKGELDLVDPHATAVFRVLQECLTNAARHSGATEVDVTLERDAEAITLTVRDNGRGFSTREPRKPGSYGLTGLRERAILLKGDVAIESEPGLGTRVVMRLPATETGEGP